MYSEAELSETRNTIEAIHPHICPNKAEHNWKECITGRSLYNGATIEAIKHLHDNPRDAAGARGILHDQVCMSGCTGTYRDEHAKRQAKTVSTLRKYLTGKL